MRNYYNIKFYHKYVGFLGKVKEGWKRAAFYLAEQPLKCRSNEAESRGGSLHLTAHVLDPKKHRDLFYSSMTAKSIT